MITYKPFFKTLRIKGITQYQLENDLNVSKGTLDSLRNNRGITLYTVEELCKILKCEPGDIFEIVEDENETFDNICKKKDGEHEIR